MLKHKKISGAIALLLCISFLICVLSSYPCVNADNDGTIKQSDIDALRAKLAKIKNDRAEAEQSLSAIKNDKNYAESAMNYAESLIDGYVKEIGIVSDIIADYNELVRQTDEKIAATQKEYDETYKIYLSRLRSSREDGEYSVIELIFNSNSFTEFISSAERILDALNYDERIMTKLETKKNVLATELKKLTDLRDIRQSEIDSYENVKEELMARITELEEFIKSLDDKREYVSGLVDQYKEDAQKTEKEITALVAAYRQQLLNEASFAQNEKMRWPLDSNLTHITSYYGTRTDPVTGAKGAFHAGIDIQASTGSNVYAALSGVVVTSSYMSYGYGYYVLIDHGVYGATGKHMYTLYAHNSKLLVSQGDIVKQGDIIALSGMSGKVTGPHCHFEVKLDKSTVNPLTYVTRPS